MYGIGLDIGGTKCAVTLGVVADGQIAIPEKIRFLTEKGGPSVVLPQCLQAIREIMGRKQLQQSDIVGVGISCGGPLDSVAGVIQSPPNLPGWDNVAITEYFRNETGIPTFLQNDANACALAEWKFGAGRGTKNMIFMTAGTGLGAGLILNGQLYAGTNDMAGEIGHVRLAEYGPVGYGKRGSAEGFFSGAGIAQQAVVRVKELVQQGENPILLQEAGGDYDRIDAALIASLADTDPLCTDIYRESGAMLGRIAAILIDLLNPERIVIGSVFARSEKLVRESMEQVIRKEALSRSTAVCRIVPAELGERLGDIAALSVAFQ